MGGCVLAGGGEGGRDGRARVSAGIRPRSASSRARPRRIQPRSRMLRDAEVMCGAAAGRLAKASLAVSASGQRSRGRGLIRMLRARGFVTAPCLLHMYASCMPARPALTPTPADAPRLAGRTRARDSVGRHLVGVATGDMVFTNSNKHMSYRLWIKYRFTV